MKPRTLADIIAMTSFTALAILLTLAATAGPAAAQKYQGPRTGVNPRLGVPPRQQSPSREVNGNLAEKERDVRYMVTQIVGFPNGESSTVSWDGTINNRGVVAGYSWSGSSINDIYLTAVPFIDENGAVKALPLLSGWSGAFAFGLTNNQQVFGAANDADSGGNIVQTAVLWHHGEPTNLGTLLPNSSATANGMNDQGVVVGGSFSFDLGVETPFVWYKGHLKALPVLGGAVGGEADGINDLGQITGSLDFGSTPPPGTGEFHSVLWTPKAGSYVVLDLGVFGGNFGSSSFGQHINNRGQVVGSATDPTGNAHACLWSRGRLQDLGLLPGGTFSEAFGINELGQILGMADRADGNWVAFLWQDGVMTDLNDLVPADTPLLSQPGGINDRGEIAAGAIFVADNTGISFVLTPVH